MGGKASLQYSVAVTDKKDGESAVYRNPMTKDELITYITPQITEIKTSFINAFKNYEGNNCLGKIIRKQGQQDTIDFKTYGQVMQNCRQIGSGIVHQNLGTFTQENGKMVLIGLFSKNRRQWTITDIACILYRITVVPIYDTLGPDNLQYILDHTQLKTIFADNASLQSLKKLKNLGKLETIITFDKVQQQDKQFFKNIKLREYDEIAQVGKNNLKDFNSQQFRVKAEDCLTFCYTSGTTGQSKGALLSHRNFASFIGGVSKVPGLDLNETDVYLSYLPLPHVLQRQILYAGLACGASGVFHCGDILQIKKDLDLVRPTIFISVPRLFSRFYEILNSRLSQRQGLTKHALDHGLSKKLNNTVTNGGYTHKVYDRLFFNKTKQALGGRCKIMISGSAPLLPQVHKFMKVTMCCPLLEGYGQTQSTGACFITHKDDPELGHIGGPWTSIEYKLVDIPEMNYTSKDKDEEGNPMPRGQIWIRGGNVFLGYFKDQQKTQQVLTQDGWLKTGDVGAILPKSKALKIIDRKKNIFKLSQGQYVAAEKVQNIYVDCHLIKQIFLHGEPTQNFAIAIVVPKKKQALLKAAAMGLQNKNYQQICTDIMFRKQFLKQMNELAKKKGIKGFQMAKNIYLQPQMFETRRIVTNTMKVQRHEAKKYYKKQIQQLYKQGALQQQKQKI